MSDIPWVLSSHERMMLRLGQAIYPDPITRATAIALGLISTPADVAGITATVAADVATINLTTNVDRRTPVTLGETLAALRTLADMEILHEARTGHVIDGRALCSRFDPVLDCIGFDVGTQTESPTYRIDDTREAA